MVFEAPIQERQFLRRVVGAGLIVSFLLGLLVLASMVNTWLPIQINLAVLASLIIYWLAARYTYFLNDPSWFRARIPALARSAIRWWVIALSFILGVALILFAFLVGVLWNIYKQDES